RNVPDAVVRKTARLSRKTPSRIRRRRRGNSSRSVWPGVSVTIGGAASDGSVSALSGIAARAARQRAVSLLHSLRTFRARPQAQNDTPRQPIEAFGRSPVEEPRGRVRQ